MPRGVECELELIYVPIPFAMIVAEITHDHRFQVAVNSLYPVSLRVVWWDSSVLNAALAQYFLDVAVQKFPTVISSKDAWGPPSVDYSLRKSSSYRFSVGRADGYAFDPPSV